MARGERPCIVALVVLALLAPALAADPSRTDALRTTPELEVFVREGCPYCATAKVFLEELRQERPGIAIVLRDVGEDPAALTRLREVGARAGVEQLGVPAFYVRGELIVGFLGADTTGARLRTLLGAPPGTAAKPADGEAVEAPLIGRLSARDLGLPLFTVALGLLDGFNPCAMWVLLFVLSLLVNLRDRTKMALIGGTFVVVSGVAYFVFMAAWLNVFLLVGVSRLLQVTLGVIAGAMGALNVKDFFAFGRGVSLGIPAGARPKLYERVRRIVQADDLLGALAGAVVLAILVNVIELLCTSGFPAVYTQVLALRQLEWWRYYAYLALYNLAYMLDDSIMLGIAVVTLGRRKLQERGGRWLKLAGGAVMLGLAAVLIARPAWLA